jgi:hypothetical protein
MLALLMVVACGAETASDIGGDGEATLSRVQSEVFTPSCAFSSCHGSSGGGAADLDLSEGAAWAEVVGVASSEAPDETLVVPGDASASYLVRKCTPGASGIVGDPMPDGGEGLDAERLALLVTWIDAGAGEE